MTTYLEINDELKPILKELIEKLNEIENELDNQLNYYKDHHIDWLKNNDFRSGTFARLLSAIVASKFTALKVLNYLEKDNWQNDFRENHMPEFWKDIDYFGHFMEIALLIRFHLFHSIYSQMETANRIIIREKGLNRRNKPAFSVNQVTNTYNEDFIKFIDFIRNTIHNNGYHFPTNENNNSWKYTFKDKDFSFEIGEPVDLEFTDIIEIINEMISALINTFRHKEIENIKLTPDIT